MKYHEIADRIEQLFREHAASGREAFENATLWFVLSLETAAQQEALDLVRARSASLPVVLTTSADVDEATRICRNAASRIRATGWYPELIATWPAPIAHEVRQLVAVLDGEGRGGLPSPEAALLQLRDVGEVVVKLPASVMARRLIARGGDDADAMRRALVTVRGGSWNGLANDAAARLRAAEPGGRLDTLAGLFLKGSVYGRTTEALSMARNRYLGHGAMRPNPAETARLIAWFVAPGPDDIPPRDTPPVSTLASGLAQAVAAAPWRDLQLQAVAPEGVIALTGAAALDTWRIDDRHRVHREETLTVQVAMPDGDTLSLSPLVAALVCRECSWRDVFFFDNVFNHKPWKLDFLDYSRGHKSRLDKDGAGALIDELSASPLADTPAPIGRASLDSGAAIIQLDRMRVDRRYRSPTYLRTGLEAFLKGGDRGAYWLQAPAHTGKTMFTLGLVEPELGEGPIVPGIGPVGGAALFTCKREYRTGRATFLNGLSEALKTALDLRRDKNAIFPALEPVLTAADPRAALVVWLDAWRVLARQPTRPLLIVIDGLDEADPPSSDDSLLRLLPSAAGLMSGLYLLLTSRPVGDADCPTWLSQALAPVLASGRHETRQLDLQAPAYLGLLQEYVGAVLGPEVAGQGPDSLAARLIAQAERRFVFLSFLVEQLRGGHETASSIGEMQTGEAIYDGFIEGLEARYGAKRADDLLAVLACLAAGEQAHAWTFGAGAVVDEATGGVLEPMPRQEWPGLELDLLATVIDMDEPPDSDGRTFGTVFVETLLLLQGTLWVWRGERAQPRYRLGLKAMAEHLAKLRPEPVARAHARLAGACLDAIEVVAEDQVGRSVARSEQRLTRGLFALLPGCVVLSGSQPIHHRFRTQPVVTAGIDIGNWISEREVGGRELIAWWSAVMLAALHEAGPAATYKRRSNDLASVYMNRGNAKQDAAGFRAGASIVDYDQAIKLREALRDSLGEDWPAPWCKGLANAYMNRGTAEEDAPGHGVKAAIVDYDRAIVLMETLRDAPNGGWPVSYRNDLAAIYMNRGNAKKFAPGHGAEAAIIDYDRAIELREALRDALGEDWPASWRDHLACAYSNRGAAKRSALEYGVEAAIIDYDRAVALMEPLHAALGEDWPLPSRIVLARAYAGRGSAKQSALGHGRAAALIDHDRAVALMEALRDALGEDWPIPWRNDLAGSYMDRGVAKQYLPEHGTAAAIVDYDRAIALQEALREGVGEDWPFSWRNDLAGTYINRGNAKQFAPGHGAGTAIGDYDRAIALLEALRAELGEDCPVRWSNELAGGYMNRGVAKQETPGDGAAAIVDFDRAIAIWERLAEALGDLPENWQSWLVRTRQARKAASVVS